MNNALKDEEVKKVNGGTAQEIEEIPPYAVGDSCIGCGAYIETCPMDAIHMSDYYKAVINQNCVGCGRCADDCPAGAIHTN